jgi:hypothetical protein
VPTKLPAPGSSSVNKEADMYKGKTLVVAAAALLASITSALSVEIGNTASVTPRSANRIQVDVPAKYKVKSIRTEVKDDKNDWTSDPQNIGWGWWIKNTREFTADGGLKIQLEYYNESGDRVRQIRAIADVE